jgi:hypothetical protein
VKDRHIATQDKPKSEAEIFHEKRIVSRKAISEAFACPIHSLPDKAAICWKDPASNLCYPITETNLNFWASQHVRTRFDICIHELTCQEGQGTRKILYHGQTF